MILFTNITVDSLSIAGGRGILEDLGLDGSPIDCFVFRSGKAAFSSGNALNSFSRLRGDRLRTSSRPGEREAEVVLPTGAFRYGTASSGTERVGGCFLFVLILFRSPS